MNKIKLKKDLLGITLAIILPIIALFLLTSMDFIYNGREWFFFYPTIFLTVWYSGARYGYLATVIFILLTTYFLLPPIYSFRTSESIYLIEIFIFTFMGFLSSFLMGEIFLKYEQSEQHSEELERSTEYLDSLLDNIPMTVFVKDASDFRYTHLNKAGEILLGIDREDFVGKNDEQLAV